jgi:nicotinate-nucleotide adenylyltransferase
MIEQLRTGLFGGTFDPPTIAHQLLAEWVLDFLNLAEVWWMPAWVNPLKQGEKISDPDIRLQMLQKSLTDFPEFVVRDDEIHRRETSYTIDTLRSLQTNHPDREFTLILGADSAVSLPRWKEYAEILDRVNIAVVVRPGCDLDKIHPSISSRLQQVEIPPLPISSTLVRARVSSGKSIRFLVSEPTRQIIHDLGLYK